MLPSFPGWHRCDNTNLLAGTEIHILSLIEFTSLDDDEITEPRTSINPGASIPMIVLAFRSADGCPSSQPSTQDSITRSDNKKHRYYRFLLYSIITDFIITEGDNKKRYYYRLLPFPIIRVMLHRAK